MVKSSPLSGGLKAVFQQDTLSSSVVLGDDSTGTNFLSLDVDGGGGDGAGVLGLVVAFQ